MIDLQKSPGRTWQIENILTKCKKKNEVMIELTFIDS